jgi:hypothetical protein
MQQIFIICTLAFFSTCFSQENTTHISSTLLEYKAEIPDTNSYEILKNYSNLEIEESILLQINFHRRHHEDFLWIVREGLEILIYSTKAIKE